MEKLPLQLLCSYGGESPVKNSSFQGLSHFIKGRGHV